MRGSKRTIASNKRLTNKDVSEAAIRLSRKPELKDKQDTWTFSPITIVGCVAHIPVTDMERQQYFSAFCALSAAWMKRFHETWHDQILSMKRDLDRMNQQYLDMVNARLQYKKKAKKRK